MPINEGNAQQEPIEGEEGYGLYRYLQKQDEPPQPYTHYHCACGHKWKSLIPSMNCPDCKNQSEIIDDTALEIINDLKGDLIEAVSIIAQMLSESKPNRFKNFTNVRADNAIKKLKERMS